MSKSDVKRLQRKSSKLINNNRALTTAIFLTIFFICTFLSLSIVR